jgi:hypothetical protein
MMGRSALSCTTQRPEGVLVQQYNLVLLLAKQRDMPSADTADKDAAQRRVEWEVREKRAVLLREQLHVRGLTLGDPDSVRICAAYGRQQRLVLEQQLMRKVSELSSANAAWQRVVSEQGARKPAALRLRRAATKEQQDTLKALEKLVEHHAQVMCIGTAVKMATSDVLGGYEAQTFAAELRSWIGSAALVHQPAEPPAWPWAADPAWLGLAPADRNQQRYFRCQEEMCILRREAGDMQRCYSAAVALADTQIQHTDQQFQQLSIRLKESMEPVERCKARKDQSIIRGRLSWQHQRADWLRRRLADSFVALRKLTEQSDSASKSPNPSVVPGSQPTPAAESQPLSIETASIHVQPPPDRACIEPAHATGVVLEGSGRHPTLGGSQDAGFGDQTSDDEEDTENDADDAAAD